MDSIELKSMESIIVKMASKTREVVEQTTRLFTERDVGVRRRIHEDINSSIIMLEELRKELVYQVLIYVARRQPLGRELTIAYALLSIAYDLYRISRYCRELARIDAALMPASGLADIKDMATVIREVLKAVDAGLLDLAEFKPARAKVIKEVDKYIDEVYASIIKEVSARDHVDRLTAFKLLAMRHIERIVDHLEYIENYMYEALY